MKIYENWTEGSRVSCTICFKKNSWFSIYIPIIDILKIIILKDKFKWFFVIRFEICPNLKKGVENMYFWELIFITFDFGAIAQNGIKFFKFSLVSSKTKWKCEIGNGPKIGSYHNYPSFIYENSFSSIYKILNKTFSWFKNFKI